MFFGQILCTAEKPNVKLVKGTNGIENELAKQIIEALPRWKAGKNKDSHSMNSENYAVNVLKVITIDFDQTEN